MSARLSLTTLWFTLGLPGRGPRFYWNICSLTAKKTFIKNRIQQGGDGGALSRRRREMDGCTFALVNDVVPLIISVLHSFGLMDFRCRGLDLSMLCDKLSCFRCSCCGLLDLLMIGLSTVMDLGRLTTVLITVSVAGPNFLPGPWGQAST